MNTKLEITNFLDRALKSLRVLNDEMSNLLEGGLQSYIHTQTNKFYFVNTFLHRGVKKRFFDIYFPIKLEHGEFVTDFKDLENIFDEYQYISIIGSAGCGKSTLTKFIFLNSIQKKIKIPVFIEFRGILDGESIEDIVIQKLLDNDAKPSKRILNRSLKNGSFVFIFDGFDEIYSKNKQSINYGLDKFVDKYPKNYFIVTSRPGAGLENYPRFSQFDVLKLKNHEIENFIEKMGLNEEKKIRILEVINASDDSKIIEYLKSPLLLSMFILSFENHPEIPKKLSIFYRNVFDTLYSRHDGISKNAYKRERISGLAKEDFEKLLQRFCYLTYLNGKFLFTEEFMIDTFNKIKTNFYIDYNSKKVLSDLITSISIVKVDGFEYSFPHRSLQEFFAAWFLKELPSEIKSKNLSRIHEKIFEHTGGRTNNFWNLCFELDEQIFLKYFIIPKMKEYLEKIDAFSKSYSNFFEFLELSESSLYFKEDKDSSDKTKILSVYTSYRSIYSNIKSFTESRLSDFHFTIWNFVDEKINNIVGEAYNDFWLSSMEDKMVIIKPEEFKGRPPSIADNEIREHIFNIFHEYGLMNLLNLELNKIQKKVSELETSVSTYMSDLDKILEFEL